MYQSFFESNEAVWVICMPWLLRSSHRHHCLCKINRCCSSIIKDLTTCPLSMSRNDRKGKYMSIFPQNNSVHKGLRCLTHWSRDKFLWKKMFKFRSEFHWKLFLKKVRINNKPALVQIMAWRRLGDMPLSETMLVRLPMHIGVTRPQRVNVTET